MLLYTSDVFETAFQSNLDDWCMGGPCPTGWTRTGSIVVLPEVTLGRHHLRDLSPDDILAKNRTEVEKWHLRFMRGQFFSEMPQYGIEETTYWKEYLFPRYGRSGGHQRVRELSDLVSNMRANGYDRKRVVWVADVRCLDLGFDYFRFDGCHRTCVAKLLGQTSIPCYVFDVVRVSAQS